MRIVTTALVVVYLAAGLGISAMTAEWMHLACRPPLPEREAYFQIVVWPVTAGQIFIRRLSGAPFVTSCGRGA